MYRRLIRNLRDTKKSLSTYTPHVDIQISKSNLLHNLKEYQRKYPNVEFAPVLKSNAYGHGLDLVAKVLDGLGLPFLIVDSLFEARTLRAEDIKSKLLIIGYVSPDNIARTRLSNLSFTITSLEQLKQVCKVVKRPTTIHIKVDTGMHRQGVSLDEINECIEIVKSNDKTTLEGVCTHLSDADAKSGDYSKQQIRVWEKVVAEFKQSFADIKYFHIAASAGTHYSNKATNNLARLGLGLYGINPSPLAKLNLQPVLEMKSVISSVRKLEPGNEVGYNRTFKAQKNMKIATVPVGYFEGVDRRLSNNGSMIVNGIKCPIVGRVSMNITSIDVSRIANPTIGDEVTVISRDKKSVNSIHNIAEQTKTIPYEILVHIPQHLLRTLVD